MVVTARIDRERLRRTRKLSEGFRKRGINPAPAMKTISLMLLSSTNTTFNAQGRPNPWRSLAPLTLALRRKGKRSGSPRILRDTGRLFQSIKNFFTKLTAGVGTNLSYAGIHQRGGSHTFPARTVKVKSHTRHIVFGKTVKPFIVNSFNREVKAKTARIPKREFLTIFEQDSKRAVDIMKRFLTKGKK